MAQRLTALTHLSFVAFDAGWPELAERLLPVLEPHRDLWAHFALFCAQPIELAMGTTLAAVGRWDEAIESARTGYSAFHDRGMRSHVPIASLYLARIVAGRRGPGDATEAATIASEGRDAARSLRMPAMTARLGELADSLVSD